MKAWRLWVVCLVAVLLSGCATSKLGVRYPHAGADDVAISRDLSRLPQDLHPYATAAGGSERLLSEARQQTLAAEFLENYYAPWKRSASLFTANEVFYMAKSHPQGRLGYAENIRPITPEAWRAMLDNANRDRFPSRNAHGITVCNVALRAMPTHKPFLKSPEIAGEGYPFDYFSHSALWAGSPVYIAHGSADGLWLFVETQRVSGWVPVRDIAFVDENFKARWRSLPLGAVARDGVVLGGKGEVTLDSAGTTGTTGTNGMGRTAGTAGNTRSASLGGSGADPFGMLHVGTLLPLQGDKVFYPVRGAGGKALLASASLKSAYVSPAIPGGAGPTGTTGAVGTAQMRTAGATSMAAGMTAGMATGTPQAGKGTIAPLIQPFPQPLTATALANMGNVMMGQPYGWGGYLENRDCSALMVDIFTPFGLWLPRNSSQQGKAGRVLSLDGLTAQEKTARIRQEGKPFTTLIWLPGHIVLYVGEYDGIPSIYHDIWGITIADETGVKSRAVIGKVAVTSLSPGLEHPLLSSPAGILDRMGALVFLGE